MSVLPLALFEINIDKQGKGLFFIWEQTNRTVKLEATPLPLFE